METTDRRESGDSLSEERLVTALRERLEHQVWANKTLQSSLSLRKRKPRKFIEGYQHGLAMAIEFLDQEAAR